jgi:acetyl esterase
MDAKSVLEPEIWEFSRKMADAYASFPPFSELTPAEQREVAEKVREPWRQGGPVMHRTTEHMLDLHHGKLRVRVYDPTPETGPKPTLLYLHGGGFTIFSIDTHDRLMREYAAASGLVVIGVDYPLGPETKFPVALEQTADLVRWLGSHGPGWNVDPARIAIGGDSAGGNISLGTALYLRDAGDGHLLRALLLNYAGFRPGATAEWQRKYGGDGFMLNGNESNYFWGNYGRGPSDFHNPYCCPILAKLEGLPPVFLVIAECDILTEQALYMEPRFREAGVEVKAEVYRGATHSFLEAMAISPVARRAIADGAHWVRAALGG